MADNNSQATFEPSIHKKHFTTEDIKILDALNIDQYEDETGLLSLCTEEGGTWGCLEQEDGTEKDLTEDDLIEVLQGVIQRSQGEVTWISKETAYTCSKMRRGQFGGSAMFITADDVRFCSTASWLEERISEMENGVVKPSENQCPMNASACSCQHCDTCYDDSLPEPAPKPSLAVMVEGGLVQCVISNQPKFFDGIDVLVYDYDTEGADDDELIEICHLDSGEITKAVGHLEPVNMTGVDLKATIGGLK